MKCKFTRGGSGSGSQRRGCRNVHRYVPREKLTQDAGNGLLFFSTVSQQAWITSGHCTSQTSTSPTGADHVPRTGPGTYQVLNKINAYLIQLLNGLHCFIVGVSCGMTVSVWSNDHILNSLSFKENGGKLVGSYQFI